jgi:hypothetical protein
VNEERAREILAELIGDFTGDLDNSGAPFIWDRSGDIVLDGTFSYEQVIAIAWWLEHKGGGA